MVNNGLYSSEIFEAFLCRAEVSEFCLSQNQNCMLSCCLALGKVLWFL